MKFFEDRVRSSKWRGYTLYPTRDADELPIHAGVYAVYFDGDLVYIGSSSNIRNRFSGHAFRYGYARNIVTPWQTIPDTVRISLKVRQSKTRGDWLMWEARLIWRLKPIFNKKLVGRGRK